MKKEYNIGDKVYLAKYERKDIRKPCPVCFGDKEVVVILGNKEQVKVECDYCGKGYDSALGYVTEWEWTPDIELVTIQGKQVNETSLGKEIEYRQSNWILNSKDLFDTKEEAEMRVREKIKAQQEEEAERYQRTKNNKIMSLTWSIGYHRREAKRYLEQTQYHSEKVKMLKEKS